MLHALRRHRRFRTLCRENGLVLDWPANRDSVAVLADIFRERTYALGFPFHEDARILDLGAHKGYFSLFASRHAGPGATVHAVEPVASNLAVLRANLAANGAGANVTVTRGAVGATSGQGTVEGAASYNHRIRLGGGDIEILTLDDVLNSLGGRADFAKMDCEGAEYDVLLDTPDDLIRRVTTWAVEFHDAGDASRTGLALRSRLHGLGYRLLRFSYSPSRTDLNYGLIVATQRL